MKQKSQVAWAGDLVSLQASSQRAQAGAAPPQKNQCVLQDKAFRICFVTMHNENQVPNARMDLATLTIICCQTFLISQIRVRSQAVEEGEAVSDLRSGCG